MNARYFRMLFHNTTAGVYHTLAVSDEMSREQVHFTFLSGGAVPEREESYQVDILAVGDCGDDTIAQTKLYVDRHKVRMAVLPFESEEKSQELREYLKSRQVEEIHFLSHNEHLNMPVKNKAALWKEGGAFASWDDQGVCLGGSIIQANWLFLFASVRGVAGSGIVVYHGAFHTDKSKEDCAFAIKPFTGEQPCVSCLLDENDHCGFGCHYQKDIDVIKAHKSGDRKEYCTGTFLTGTAISEETARELKEEMEFLSGEMRVLALPAHQKGYDPHMLDELKGKDYLYVTLPGEHADPGLIGSISLASPYFRCAPLSREYGLCACGYFVPYLREKKVQP